VDELFLDGPVEVGLSPDGACTLGLREIFLPPGNVSPVGRGEVVLVTGGARGVTLEAVLALARTAAPHLVLLGRTQPPQAEPDWLASLQSEPAIKQALHVRFPNANPRELNSRYQQIQLQREVYLNLQRLEQAGAQVMYRQLDVRDPTAVMTLCAEVRSHLGPIRGVIHGAGVLADRPIEDKTEEQFRTVYETKVSGLKNVLAALEQEPLKFIALFSSSTARFGRAGQVDYAIANEVLNKLGQHESRRRPGCRVVACNWGPWDGGMVQPALKRVFADEGLTLIPLGAGADFLVREISAESDAPVEVVVLGRGSEFEFNAPERKSTQSEIAAMPTDGIPWDGGTMPAAVSQLPRISPTALTPAFRQVISLERQPVLSAHVIGGRAVVPVVLLVEWMAHGALHANPGLSFHGLNDLRVFRGIKLEADASCTIEIRTGRAVKKDGFYQVPVELRAMADQAEGALHAGATVILASQLPVAPAAEPLPQMKPYDVSCTEVYESILFHGPDFQGIEQVDGVGEHGVIGRARPAPAPSRWLQQPLRQAWLADPLILDSAFQLMVLWTQEQHGVPSLPTGLLRYRQYRRAFPRDGVRVVARIVRQVHQQAIADIDILDETGAIVAGITGYECVLDASLRDSFRQNRLAPAVLSGR
jgi:NAD(P)-dependent dehydrogenase (short-subunit alcohol dehydrogenase family)